MPERRARLGAAAAALVLAAPAAASAQGGPGFLFNDPKVSFGFRAGYGVPTVSSDLFDERFEMFTLDREDFRGVTLGGEVAVHLNERWDVALSGVYHGRRVQSEYVEYYEFDPDNPTLEIPIVQETWFRTVPVTVGAKYHFVDRGRSIGRFAWVPARFTPFVSAGAGLVAWRFEQTGDFVAEDEPGLPIVFDRISASGVGPYVHAGGGAALSLTKNLVLSLEGRYGWGRGDPEPEFREYEDLDLSGVEVLAGISVRF